MALTKFAWKPRFFILVVSAYVLVGAFLNALGLYFLRFDLSVFFSMLIGGVGNFLLLGIRLRKKANGIITTEVYEKPYALTVALFIVLLSWGFTEMLCRIHFVSACNRNSLLFNSFVGVWIVFVYLGRTVFLFFSNRRR